MQVEGARADALQMRNERDAALRDKETALQDLSVCA